MRLLDEQGLGGRISFGERRVSSETGAGLAPRIGTYLTINVARYDPPQSTCWNRILQLKCPEASQSEEVVRTAAESGSPIHVWGKKVSVSERAPAHLPAGVDVAVKRCEWVIGTPANLNIVPSKPKVCSDLNMFCLVSHGYCLSKTKTPVDYFP